MDDYLIFTTQKKILFLLKHRQPDITTDDDYRKMLGLFESEPALHHCLLRLEQQGLITSGLVRTFNGYICDLNHLALVR